jgi:hypothetical protein
MGGGGCRLQLMALLGVVPGDGTFIVEAVIRYYEAELPDGRRLPICAVAQDDGGGLVKRPDSPPGSAFLPDSGTGLTIVSVFP